MNSTLSQRPSRHAARASTTPPGASSRTTVSGSRSSSMPVSSRTVVVQIVFEPDMAGYSVGSMMMKPASQSGRVAGTTRFAWQATLPRGSRNRSFRSQSPSRWSVCICSNTVAPAGGSTPPTTTLPISPPAWQPTTVITRRVRTARPYPRRYAPLVIDRSLFGQEHVRRYQETDGEVGYLWNGAPIALLTTTGRRTGDPTTTPLIFGRDGDNVVLIASQGGAPEHPGWYRNLAKQPEVELQVKGDHLRGRARTAAGDERERLWRQMAEIWPHYDEYATRTEREIPVVVVEPLEP